MIVLASKSPRRQELMRLYCEEDLSQQEIADQLAITRQGVFDALAKAKKLGEQ